MIKIRLTQGKYTIVDNEDFEWLNQWKWHYNNGYAMRRKHIFGEKRGIYISMHNFINQTPSGFDTDHINRNGLDNRKRNLRTVTHQQNAFNAKLNIKNTSGYKGIFWDRFTNNWRVHITLNNKYVHLGRYAKIKEAISIRKEAEKLYHAI